MLIAEVLRTAFLVTVLGHSASYSAAEQSQENKGLESVLQWKQRNRLGEQLTLSVICEQSKREALSELSLDRLFNTTKAKDPFLLSNSDNQASTPCFLGGPVFLCKSLPSEVHSAPALSSSRPCSSEVRNHPSSRKLYTAFDWTQPKYYTVTRTVTIGKSIFYINRTPEGLLLSEFDTTTKAWVMMTEYPAMTDAEGWTAEPRYSTIRVVAVKGSVYIFGRGEMYTYLVSYEPVASEWRTLPWHTFLQDSEGYSLPQYYRTVQMEAVDSSLFITARGASGVAIASFNIDTQQWATLPSLHEFTDNAIWSLPQYYMTFRLVAFQSFLWLHARGPLGINLIEFDTQSSQWGHSVLQYSYFTDAQGANGASYYETMSIASIPTGIYIFSRVPLGIDTVYFEPSTRSFMLTALLPMCTTIGGWTAPEYYTTIQMMTCGGAAYVLARGYSNLHQANLPYPSGSWTFAMTFNAYSNPQGWGVPYRYFTFRGACVGSDMYVIGRDGDQLKTMSTTPPSASWHGEITLYGFCSAPCRTCDAAGTDHCIACAGSAYLVGSFPSHCEPCHNTCRSCSGKLSTDCIRCWEHATRQGNGTCHCEGDYFLNQLGRCDTCDLSCASCAGSGDLMCTSCLEHSELVSTPPSACICSAGFYLNAESLNCSKCAKFCVSCTGPLECTECAQNSYLQGTSCECSPGSYESLDSNQCKRCSIGCWECLSTKCIRCQLNWFLYQGECVSICPTGLHSVNGTCELDPPVPSLLVYPNNTVECSFSKELTKNLENEDISIYVKAEVDFDVVWSISTKYKFQVFEIDLEFTNDRPTVVSALRLSFLRPSELHDSSGTAIATTELSGFLSPYSKSHPSPSAQAAVSSAISHTVMVSAVAASVLSSNPSTLFSLLNQLQLITYIPMMNIDLPTGFAETLKGLSVTQFTVNPFAIIYKDTDVPGFAQRYGFDSALFLVNSGLLCISFTVLLASFCVVWNLARLTATRTLSRYFQEVCKNYKWGYFLRFWIQSYLDLGISALLHFYAFPQSARGFIENSVLAGGCLLCFFLSPLVFVYFVIRKKDLFLHRTSPAFNETWGLFFLEFTQSSHISSIVFYPSYIIRRCIYGSVLVLLSFTPAFQSLVSIATSASVIHTQILCHLALFRPHRRRLGQAAEILTEAATLVTFSISACYLIVARASTAGKVLSEVGRAVVLGSIACHFVLSICSLATVVGKLVQQFRRVLASNKEQKKKTDTEGSRSGRASVCIG